MWGSRGGKGDDAVVQASSFVESPRTYGCAWWFGKGGGDDAVGLGDDDCGGSLTIAGTRMISSCSKVVASITCNRDVCYRPWPHVKSQYPRIR